MLEGEEEEKRADTPEPDTLVLVCDDVIDTIELIDVINDIFVPEGLAIIPITVADCCSIGVVAAVWDCSDSHPIKPSTVS